MFFTVCLVLISQTGYPMLGGQDLVAPTRKDETQFKELMAELEVASLKFDRFAVMCKGTRSVTWERDGGGSEIIDFRSVYAEDFDKKCRRIMHVGDSVFRDDGRAQLGRYTMLGNPMADCYVETKPGGHIWITSGGSAVLDKPKDAANRGVHTLKSVFRLRVAGNPFCMAQFASHNYMACACTGVYLAGLERGKLGGVVRVNGLTVFHVRFPLLDPKVPKEFGVSQYYGFRGKELVVNEEWFGKQHGSADKRHLQSRVVTTWGVQDGERLPVSIHSQQGNPATVETEMEFAWRVNDACPATLFQNDNVGELALGQFFE